MGAGVGGASIKLGMMVATSVGAGLAVFVVGNAAKKQGYDLRV